MGFVYILASQKNGTLYVGSTVDLYERIRLHREGAFEGFTKRYGVTRLVYAEVHGTLTEAILRERRIKRWRRGWKIALIENENPGWEDVGRNFFAS
jgi:putative endonuclease